MRYERSGGHTPRAVWPPFRLRYLALTEIRDSKLYRADFDTFEAYCKSKWGWERAHAYRLITAAEIKMSPMGDKITTERQAREPAKVEPVHRVEVLIKATEQWSITANSFATPSPIVKMPPPISIQPKPTYRNLHAIKREYEAKRKQERDLAWLIKCRTR